MMHEKDQQDMIDTTLLLSVRAYEVKMPSLFAVASLYSIARAPSCAALSRCATLPSATYCRLVQAPILNLLRWQPR